MNRSGRKKEPKRTCHHERHGELGIKRASLLFAIELAGLVKEKDHAQDATRYLIVSGLDIAGVNTSADAAAYRRFRGYA